MPTAALPRLLALTRPPVTIVASASALQPASLEEVQAHVQAAVAAGQALEVLGAGSKRFYGRRVRAAEQLSVAGLRGVLDYQPHELVMVARPGTSLEELEATLAEAGQMLAFEPPHWGAGATLGGTLACNLSGPRRIKAGAARDHLLGFQAVTGTGEAIRGGGRVVKNVTGYDLSKLMCGSFGTLGVLTEVAVKVLPRAEAEYTVLFRGLDAAVGVARLIAAARSQAEPSALAHLPAGTSLPEAAAGTPGPLTALRMEGPEPSVRSRAETLATGGGAVLEAEASRAFWVALRELKPLPLGEGERLWRFSVPPAAGAPLGARLAALGDVRHFYDWGGALLWAAIASRHTPAELHALARSAGGHAQLVRDAAHPPAGAAAEPVFATLSPVQRRLTENLKRAFDPHGVLNPGRMYADL